MNWTFKKRKKEIVSRYIMKDTARNLQIKKIYPFGNILDLGRHNVEVHGWYEVYDADKLKI